MHRPLAPECEPARHLYVHIPFCPSKCSYCAFVTHIGSPRLVEPYLAALRTHAKRLRSQYPTAPLETLYFGGGTPSMLTPAQIGGIVESAGEQIGLAADSEITIEAHPATVGDDTLRGYRERGVNRISFGAESLVDAELDAIGRLHGRTGVERAVNAAREAGFSNLALDLMYGLPGQTHRSWEATLDSAAQLRPDHFSLYPLSIEPQTVFARRQREGRLSVPDDERVVEMYEIACETLARAGYEHYEVSNWALPGHRSRHNMAYWLNRPYLALGVGAHAYLPPYRVEHVRRVREYIELVTSGREPVATRTLIDDRAERAETVMLRLRLLTDGLDTRWFDERFGGAVRGTYDRELDQLVSRSQLTDDGCVLRIPESGVPMANEVWSIFM